MVNKTAGSSLSDVASICMRFRWGTFSGYKVLRQAVRLNQFGLYIFCRAVLKFLEGLFFRPIRQEGFAGEALLWLANALAAGHFALRLKAHPMAGFAGFFECVTILKARWALPSG
jgi:hypothetical protein